MAVKNIKDTKVKIYNPYGLYVTPLNAAGTAKGADTYFLDEVIRDTTTITQDDPEEKPNSLVADFDLLGETISESLKNRQIQPVLRPKKV